VAWLGTALRDVRAFPAATRQDLGYQLYRVQQGLEPSDWKPMPVVGAGVFEVRIRTGGAFRVLYVTKFAEAIYVLHAFEKRSQKTGQAELDLARRRYAALVASRRMGGGGRAAS
jgi:phage-related protein